MNGFRSDGTWMNNAMTAYPHKSGYAGSPEFGTSGNLMRRGYFFAYLNGANVTQVEEWSAQYLAWDEAAGKTVLTPRGRDYIAYHNFTRANPGRGSTYTPVAICVPISQGYTAYGGHPWGEPSFGYTRGDHAVDAVFYTLVPGFERARAMKAGVESNLHNSKFAHMYDVVCPDVASQSDSETLEVLKSYRALVVAGDFDDDKTRRCLAAYEKAGGRVIRIGGNEVPEPGRSCANDIIAGRLAFPKVEKILSDLQDEYFPVSVEGDCLYGINRTKSGWWLWAFNNRGVTKFADRPHSVDRAFDTTLRVKAKHITIKSAKELVSNSGIPVKNGEFQFRVPAGDVAVFELK